MPKVDDDYASPIPKTPNKQMRETTHSPTRLGISEPHFLVIDYLHDVLSTNFPENRTFCNFLHYFRLDDEKIGMSFDISYFKGFNPPYRLSFYDSDEFDGRIPTMVINIISSSTYNDDLGLTAQICQKLGIPIYVLFSGYLPDPAIVKAPFLKIIYLDDGNYHIADLSEVCCIEGKGYISYKKLIDIRPDILPFKFGIMELQGKYRKNHKDYPTYRLVLIDREKRRIIKTRAEICQMEAEKQIKEAEKNASKKIEKKKKEMEKEKGRISEKLRKAEKMLEEKEKEAEKERNRADGAMRRAEKAEKELKRLKKSN